jgi:hypothetical protein
MNIPVTSGDQALRDEIERWKAYAWDLGLSNDRLRLAIDVLKGDLAEERAKHA